MARSIDNHLHYHVGSPVTNYHDVASWLIDGEEVLAMSESQPTVCVFTNKRIIIRGRSTTDDASLIGKEMFSTTIPYRSIFMFSYEVSDTKLLSTKNVDFWIGGGSVVSLHFNRNADINPLKKILPKYVC